MKPPTPLPMHMINARLAMLQQAADQAHELNEVREFGSVVERLENMRTDCMRLDGLLAEIQEDVSKRAGIGRWQVKMLFGVLPIGFEYKARA